MLVILPHNLGHVAGRRTELHIRQQLPFDDPHRIAALRSVLPNSRHGTRSSRIGAAIADTLSGHRQRAALPVRPRQSSLPAIDQPGGRPCGKQGVTRPVPLNCVKLVNHKVGWLFNKRLEATLERVLRYSKGRIGA